MTGAWYFVAKDAVKSKSSPSSSDLPLRKLDEAKHLLVNPFDLFICAGLTVVKARAQQECRSFMPDLKCEPQLRMGAKLMQFSLSTKTYVSKKYHFPELQRSRQISATRVCDGDTVDIYLKK
jgi:hypothetical protein